MISLTPSSSSGEPAAGLASACLACALPAPQGGSTNCRGQRSEDPPDRERRGGSSNKERAA
jgi:hypothetical protein